MNEFGNVVILHTLRVPHVYLVDFCMEPKQSSSHLAKVTWYENCIKLLKCFQFYRLTFAYIMNHAKQKTKIATEVDNQ